jgi:hypothetical protein
MLDGKLPQQQLIHQAEDRRIRANAERQRNDGDQREARILDEHAKAEANVLQ